MNTDPVTLTLPFLTWQGLNVLLAALGVAGATGLIWLMLTGAERDHPPKLESWFKPMAVVLGVVWIWLLGATLWGLWQVFNGVEGAPLAGGSLGLGALIAAFLGAPFVIYGTYLRHKTQRLEQEGHMTDRITKAVEQLGTEKTIKEPDGAGKTVERTVPNIEVRMGAILSLERIAQDSTMHDKGRDHVRVMEILCAYIRENTTTPDLSADADHDGPFRVRTDVQMAIDVVKRRDHTQQKIEEGAKYRLNLKECDFRGADLSKGSFRGAVFSSCRFDFSLLNASDFSGAIFYKSILNYVWARKADFTGAQMHSIRIDKPRPTVGGFVSSINLGNLKGVSFAGANISAVQYIREETPTFGTKDTLLSVEMEEQREQAISMSKIKKSAIPNAGLEAETAPYAFASWSPYDSSDMATGVLLSELHQKIGLTGWPYNE